MLTWSRRNGSGSRSHNIPGAASIHSRGFGARAKGNSIAARFTRVPVVVRTRRQGATGRSLDVNANAPARKPLRRPPAENEGAASARREDLSTASSGADLRLEFRRFFAGGH